MDKRNKTSAGKSNKEICLLYLKKYEEKDLNSIGEMFSEDIVLRDWKIRVEGKENALNETRKNFENADSIEIEVLSTCENKDTVASELKITIDSTEELYVVDVISINSNGKIKSIRAYLGRGNE
jgi:ketosteroid isomerase-like protein